MLSFEDEPDNGAPIQVEGLNVNAGEELVDESLLHLGAGSLSDLEARARRAVGRSSSD